METIENTEKKDIHYIYDHIVELYGENFIKYLPNILNHVANYMNKAMDVLSTRNVGIHLIYTSSIENDLYDCCLVEKSEIIRIINSCTNIKLNIQDAVTPIYNFLMVLSCFYRQHEKELMQKYKFKSSPADIIIIYLGLRIYSISQRQIFHHEPKEDIMDYTLEHLTGKYDILKYDNAFCWLEDYVKTNNSALEADLTYIEDYNIYEWVSKLIKRIKSVLINIYREFDKNHKANRSYQNDAMVATNKEDGKKFYTEMASASNDVALLTTKYVNGFIGEPVVREDIIKLVIKRGQKINSVKLTSIINEMIHNKKSIDKITTMVKDLLSYWVISCRNSVESIHSMNFIKSAISVYSMSNTKNDYILDVKRILTDIVVEYGSSLLDVSKTSTVNAFKQDIYLYIVFYMVTIK